MELNCGAVKCYRLSNRMRFLVIYAVFASVTIGQSAPHRACPPSFTPIGRKCYYFSPDEATWQDAHYKCLSINSTLAVISKPHQESLIRTHLNARPGTYGQREQWIGGRFNWQQEKWVWAISGKPLVFHAFSRMNPSVKDRWKWACIIVDPERQNKWYARSCVEKKHFICQTLDKYPLEHSRDFDKTECLKRNSTDSNEKKLCRRYLNYLNRHPNEPATLINAVKKVQKLRKDFACSSNMILVGRKCYFFSTDSLTWNEAYWACRDNTSSLAIIQNRHQDKILRGFLNANFVEKHERWIGGIYDWKQQTWKWAINGKRLKYQNFPKNVMHDKNWNCITLDPTLQHRWNSKNQSDRNHYICQTKAKSVVKYGRFHKFKPNATVVIGIDKNDSNTA